jgi:hypothetical protein
MKAVEKLLRTLGFEKMTEGKKEIDKEFERI